MGGISIWQLLIVLVIVLLIFGTKKFRNMGNDLGSAVKGFRNAMNDGEENKKQDQHIENKTAEQSIDNKTQNGVIDVEVVKKEEAKKES